VIRPIVGGKEEIVPRTAAYGASAAAVEAPAAEEAPF